MFIPRERKKYPLAMYVIQLIIYFLAGDRNYSILEQNTSKIKEYRVYFFRSIYSSCSNGKKVIHLAAGGDNFQIPNFLVRKC